VSLVCFGIGFFILGIGFGFTSFSMVYLGVLVL